MTSRTFKASLQKQRGLYISEAIRDKTARKAEAEDFIRELMKQPALITEFDPIAYHILVERMTVFKKDRVVVRFKNGIEIEA